MCLVLRRITLVTKRYGPRQGVVYFVYFVVMKGVYKKNPNSPSYRDLTSKQIYSKHEQEKKSAYNERILQIEKGSFTPLIFSTTGGMGPESTKYHKRVAGLIADKRNENYSDVTNHILTRLRFALLRSVLIAVRGQRGKNRKDTPISDLSLNLIPDRAAYEV